MPAAMTLISSQTLGSAVSSVTFGSGGTLTQAYRDLRLVVYVPSLSGNPASRGGYITLNGTGGTSVYMTGNGSTASSGTDGTDMIFPVANADGVYTVDVLDYSATDKHKTVLTRGSIGSTAVWSIASRCAITAAVTSLVVVAPDSASKTFSVGSTFVLYGVSA